MAHKDLREWLNIVDGLGELTRVDGASTVHEIGAASWLSSDALLFDNIPGYPPGYRVLSKLTVGKRFFSTLDIPESRGNALAKHWCEKLKAYRPVPPAFVGTGPILENSQEGADVDLTKFPVPIIHEKDAGPYIGTAHAVITRDPDEGWINLGSYRML